MLGHKLLLFMPLWLHTLYLKVFGGNSEEDPPVPIPNTEVKLLCADGTAWESAWESRSPPKFIFKKPLILCMRGFFYG